MEANQAATELLLKGTTVLGQDGKQHTVHFIDFDPDNRDRNDFLAINQYRVDPSWVTGNRGFIVPDIVLLVNGIPLVVIECKSPKLDNPITEAIRDLLQYSNQRGSSQPEGAEKLFHYNQLMIAASRGRAAAGTIGANYEHYVEWKDTTPRPKAEIAAELGVTVSDSVTLANSTPAKCSLPGCYNPPTSSTSCETSPCSKPAADAPSNLFPVTNNIGQSTKPSGDSCTTQPAANTAATTNAAVSSGIPKVPAKA
jgi:hypothetical protein